MTQRIRPPNWREQLDREPMDHVPVMRPKTHMSGKGLLAAAAMAIPSLAIWFALAYWLGWIN